MIFSVDFIIFSFSVFFIFLGCFFFLYFFCILKKKVSYSPYISTLGHSQVCFSNSTNNYCLIYVAGFVCLLGDSRRLCFSQNLQVYGFFYLFIYLFFCFFALVLWKKSSIYFINSHADIAEFTKITVRNNGFLGELC